MSRKLSRWPSGPVPLSLLGIPNARRVGLIVLAFLASLVAGASGLIYDSALSPLIVGGAFAAMAVGIAWLRKPVWALYAALFVVLLPEGLIPAHVNSFLNRGILIVALGVWLLDVIGRRRQVVLTSTALLMLGFLAWSTVTLSWASDLGAGMDSLAKYALRFILFLLLIANEIDTRKTLGGLMGTLALSGWVLVLAGVEAVVSGGIEAGTRLQVQGMNQNQFGVSILVTMSGVLWQAMQAPQGQRALRMLLSYVFILLALGLVALSGSRGSAISMLMTLALFWFWKPTRTWGKLSLVMLALGVVIAPFVFSTTLERFALDRGDTVLGGREGLWLAGWQLIRDHPWRGVGIGNGPYAVMPYAALFRSLLGSEWAPIHNPVLTVWAETGVPGLLLCLGVLGSAIGLFLWKYLDSRSTGMHSLTPYYALVSSVFVGFVPSWIKGGGMETHFTFFLMLALLLIPSRLGIEGWERNSESAIRGTGTDG